MEDKKNKENQELVLTDIYTNDEDVQITQEERVETIVEDKNKKKVKKNKVKKQCFSLKLKTFFFGLGKEFERMSWTSKSDLIKNFIVVICIVVILTAIFTGVGIGMQKLLSL